MSDECVHHADWTVSGVCYGCLGMFPNVPDRPHPKTTLKTVAKVGALDVLKTVAQCFLVVASWVAGLQIGMSFW